MRFLNDSRTLDTFFEDASGRLFGGHGGLAAPLRFADGCGSRPFAVAPVRLSGMAPRSRRGGDRTGGRSRTPGCTHGRPNAATAAVRVEHERGGLFQAFPQG